MKLYQKFAMGLLAFVGLTACGSGQSSAPVSYSDTAATTTAASTGGTVTSTTTSGAVTTIDYADGTVKTLTNVFPNYYTTLNGTFTFTETATVSAGDEVLINLSGSQETYTGFPSSTQTLDDFQVHFNGVEMYSTGASMYGSYTFPAAATVTFSTDWEIGNNAGTHVIQMPYSGGVFISHCVSPSGASEACPY